VYHGLPGFDPENPDEWPGRPQDFEAPVRIDQNVLNLMAAPHLEILNEGFNNEDDEDDEDDVFQEPLAIMVDGVPMTLLRCQTLKKQTLPTMTRWSLNGPLAH